MRTYDTPIGELPSVTWILGESVTKPWMPNYIKKWARECFWDMVNNSGPINSVQPEPCSKCGGDGKYDGSTDSPICKHCEGQGYHPIILPNIEISDIQYCLDAHKRHSDKALEIGSLVHSMIEVYEKLCKSGKTTDAGDYYDLLCEYYPDLVEYFNTYHNVMSVFNIKILESEQMVYHPMGYAGTLDLICEMDGKLWIGDIKTFESKQYKSGKPKKPLFKKEHYAQTEAYRRAYNNKVPPIYKFEHGGEGMINNRFILWLDKRQQDNYYLEIIDEKLNEKHWDMWCTAFNHWKAWK